MGRSMIAAVSLLVGGGLLAEFSRLRELARRRWLTSALKVAGQTDEAVQASPRFDLDDDLGGVVPPELRSAIPEVPIVGFTYQSNCGSCTRLWNVMHSDPQLERVALVFGSRSRPRLAQSGVLRAPMIELDDELMVDIPSGLMFEVDAQWNILNPTFIASVEDARRFMSGVGL